VANCQSSLRGMHYMLCYNSVTGRKARPVLCALRTRTSVLAPLIWKNSGVSCRASRDLEPQIAFQTESMRQDYL
jgi:hypothetical protein